MTRKTSLPAVVIKESGNPWFYEMIRCNIRLQGVDLHRSYAGAAPFL